MIELEADAAIRFLQRGEQIRELEVTPGETVRFACTVPGHYHTMQGDFVISQ